MEPGAIALNPLDRVTKSVSEIQMCPRATLALIGCHDGGLDGTAALDSKRQRHLLSALQRLDVVDEPGKKPGIANETVLDDLG